jgi:hypothetical protein
LNRRAGSFADLWHTTSQEEDARAAAKSEKDGGARLKREDNGAATAQHGEEGSPPAKPVQDRNVAIKVEEAGGAALKAEEEHSADAEAQQGTGATGQSDRDGGADVKYEPSVRFFQPTDATPQWGPRIQKVQTPAKESPAVKGLKEETSDTPKTEDEIEIV